MRQSSADEIRRAAAEVLARPYFHADGAADRNNPPLWWIILRALFKPFAWLFDQLEGLPDVLRWLIVIFAALICCALIAHIVYTLLRAMRMPLRSDKGSQLKRAKDVEPGDLERQAEDLGARGDYAAAIRLLLHAAMRRLEHVENKRFRPGFTNRDLLRQYQSKPPFDAMERLVRMVDLTWYGGRPCPPAEFADCQLAHAWIRTYAEERRRVDGK